MADLRTSLLTLERNLRADANNHGTDVRHPRLVLENRANDVARLVTALDSLKDDLIAVINAEVDHARCAKRACQGVAQLLGGAE